MRPIGIALLADFYTSWMGGANLLSFLVNGLLGAAERQQARIHVMLDARGLPAPVREQVRDFLPVPVSAMATDGPLRCLLESAPRLTEVMFHRDLRATLDALSIDVVGPCGDDLGADFPRPWFGYLPDFQHQHLPQFFSADERVRRDQHARRLVENASGLFVNSASVAADVARFYPGAARGKAVHRFPMVFPDLSAANPAQRAATLERHRISGPYLLSCSQRWMHKQHEFVLAAFAEHRRDHPRSPLQLLFTGEASDHRDPGYAPAVEALVDTLGLRAHVRHLGMVPRAEQLQLVAGAQALVHASLFEGGPGASGTLEAALLGTPVLASDIAPNRELAFGQVRWFDPHRTTTLAHAIGGLASDPPARDAPFDADEIASLAAASGLQTIAALRAACRPTTKEPLR